MNESRQVSSLTGKLRRRLFGLSESEALFSSRGFSAETKAVTYLEGLGATFIAGYNAGLEADSQSQLAETLDRTDAELVGFAWEGASMALALMDLLTPWNRNRLNTFLSGPGDKHYYMVLIGAGWALARLGRAVEPFLRRHDPLYRWLVMDGYGFHQGYFHWRLYIEQHQPEKKLTGYAARAFDQGLGRAMWFVSGADLEKVTANVMTFPKERHSDLFSGLGLAAAYAGKPSADELQLWLGLPSEYLSSIRQGVAFAAKARQRAGNPAAHTEVACLELCGMTADEAAACTDEALKNLPEGTDATPAFEIWRQRLQNMMIKEKTAT
jgi:hypothetical protein